MSKGLVLVVFESATMRKLFAAFLEGEGYAVIEAESGSEALGRVAERKPRLVLCSTDLTDISGGNVTRIIKNSPEFAGTSVVLCPIDDAAVTRFWAENAGCDALFVPTGDNFAELAPILEKLASAQSGKSGKSGKKTATKNAAAAKTDSVDLLSRAFKALDSDLFSLYLTKNAFKNSAIDDIAELIRMMVDDISSILSFDALGVVVNADRIFQFYHVSSRMKKAEYNDFVHVCRTDFEKKLPAGKKFRWQAAELEKQTFKQAGGADTIKAFETFPRESGEPPVFTLHIGTFSPSAFRPRHGERLELLVRVYSQVMRRTLALKHAAAAEASMRRAFSRFVPEKIIDDVIAGAQTAQSVGERRKVAVLISDIRSFTTLSEMNQPETIVAFLNNFFSTMGRIIKKHGGIIDKFMGDAIMALFGAPESFPDNANRAANAALEMQAALKKLAVPLTMPEGFAFSIGIGIHYGEAIVGAIGSDDKREYTVIGDSVNIASRVEGLTKLYGATIIVSDSVKQDLRDGQFVRHLDNVKVKGKSVALAIYALEPPGYQADAEFLENYKKGINQYAIGNFTIAEEYFYKAHCANPGDKAAAVLLGRCEEFIETPPEDWDGAIALTTK